MLPPGSCPLYGEAFSHMAGTGAGCDSLETPMLQEGLCPPSRPHCPVSAAAPAHNLNIHPHTHPHPHLNTDFPQKLCHSHQMTGKSSVVESQ